MLIASVSLMAAGILLRARDWPEDRYPSVAVVTIALAMSYTMFSEWWNVEVRQAWAYREMMPRPVLARCCNGLSCRCWSSGSLRVCLGDHRRGDQKAN